MMTRFPTMQQRMFDNREAVKAVEKILRKILKNISRTDHARVSAALIPRLVLT